MKHFSIGVPSNKSVLLDVCGSKQYTSMANIHELAEKAFGKYGFAGFTMIVRETGHRIGVYIDSSTDIKHHKFDVLAQACIMRPYLAVNEARQCIEHICCVTFTDEEFSKAEEYILSNWEQLYNEINNKLEED